jgi:hypothetical protein
MIAAVEREPWRNSRIIARELQISQSRVFEVLYKDQLHPYHYSGSSHLFADDRPPSMQFFEWPWHQHPADEFFLHNILWIDEACFTHEGACTVHHGIIMLSAKVAIKSASALAFMLLSPRTLWWASICILTGWLLNDTVIFLKMSYRGRLRCASSASQAGVVVWARCTSSALWGRCPAVVERDTASKVDWAWRADCTASVTGSNPDGFFPVETPEGTCLLSPFQDYRISRDKTSSSCDNGRCQHVKACSRDCRDAHCHMPWNGRTLLRKYTYYSYEAPVVWSFYSLCIFTVICILRPKLHIIILYSRPVFKQRITIWTACTRISFHLVYASASLSAYLPICLPVYISVCLFPTEIN